MIRFQFILFAIGIIFSVKSQSIDSIGYLSGGGVTGTVTAYRFNKKSITFAEGRINLNYLFNKKMKKSKWKKVTQLANKILNENITFYTPANYYQSITIFHGVEINKYMWPINTNDIPNSLSNLIKLLENIK